MTFLKDNLTIVVPCKNEGVNLGSTLLKVLAHTDCTVIVADSSEDDTLKFVRVLNGLTDWPRIQVVDGGLPAIARNNGFNLVTTPYVLFLDADMDISTVPLESMLEQVIANDIKLATCKITSNKYKVVYKVFEIIQWFISSKTPFAVGGFMLFNSEHFKQLGRFNVNDRIAEDYHLSMKVSPGQFKIFPYKINTSDRRLKNKGVWYMIKLMLKCYQNRNDDNFYKNDYNYWK